MATLGRTYVVPVAVLLLVAASVVLLRSRPDATPPRLDGFEEVAESPAQVALRGDIPPAPPDARERTLLQEQAAEPAATIHGRLTFAEGVAGSTGEAQVRLSAVAPGFCPPALQAMVSGLFQSRAPVDEDGRFVMPIGSDVGYLDVDHPYIGPTRAVLVSVATGSIELPVRVGGRVVGRVIADDGTPVAGADVSVRRSIDLSDLTRDLSSLQLTSRTETAEDGAFEIRAIPPGVDWQLEVRATGHPTAIVGLDIEASRTERREITLSAGATLSGSVVGPNGEPVPGARVALRVGRISFSNKRSMFDGNKQVDAVTDGGGEFRIDGLPAGRFDISARADGFAPSSVVEVEVTAPKTRMPEPLVLETGRPIRGVVIDADGQPVAGATVGFVLARRIMGFSMSDSLPASEAENLGGVITKTGDDGRFVSPPLREGTYDVLVSAKSFRRGGQNDVAAGTVGVTVELERLASIHGVVLSREESEPVLRYRIGVERPISFLDPSSFLPGPSREVIGDGTFTLDGIEAGTWKLVVIGDGYARYESDPIEIRPGEEVRGLIVFLDPEARVTGRVVDARDDAPIVNALVTLRSGLDALRRDAFHTALDVHSQDDGTFALRGLAAGRYQLSVTAADYAPGSSPRLTVVARQTLDGVVVRLDPGAVIQGTVVGADGNPESGALMQAVVAGSLTPAMTTTNEEGWYELRGLAAGSYTVNKIGGSMSLDMDRMMSSLTEGLASKTIEVQKGGVVRLDFDGRRHGVTVRGRVTAAFEPVAQAFLTFMPIEAGDEDGLRLATTDRDGRYEITGVSPGEWTVTVQTGTSLSDSSKQSFDVELDDRPEIERDFELDVTGIAGTIFAADRAAPLGGVRVAITAVDDNATVDAMTRAAGSSRVADVISGSDGRYRATGLRPGRYRVVAGGPGMFGLGGGYQQSDPAEVTLHQAQLLDGIDFHLDEGAAVEGRVTDELGRGVTGASLFFQPHDKQVDRHFGEIVTDDGGNYRASGLQAGRYSVVAKASGYAPSVDSRVVARQGETSECDLVLRRGGRVIVEVTGPDGTSVAGAQVTLLDADGTDYSKLVSISDAISALGAAHTVGRFDLGPLAPGTYMATVTKGNLSIGRDFVHGTADETIELVIE